MELNPELRTQDSVLPPIILVCQGAEYNAVCRGLSRVNSSKPLVLSIPMGKKNTSIYLQNYQWQQILNHPQPRVLVMGLCGSLKARYKVGDIVLYQDCVYQADSTPLVKPCDTFIKQYHYFQDISIVRALSGDRIICSAAEKRHLGEMTGADVVDMEGEAILEFFSQAGVAVTMLRVVSDDCYHDLPNLTAVLSPEGVLQPLPLAMAMLRQPIAATRLIRGSLRGLQVLQQVTTRLFSS